MPLNKTAAAYTPEPGCLAARVVNLISRNLEEEFTSGDLCAKFDAVVSSVQGQLETPVGHGLLAFERAEGGNGKVWRAGPNLRDMQTLTADQLRGMLMDFVLEEACEVEHYEPFKGADLLAALQAIYAPAAQAPADDRTGDLFETQREAAEA